MNAYRVTEEEIPYPGPASVSGVVQEATRDNVWAALDLALRWKYSREQRHWEIHTEQASREGYTAALSRPGEAFDVQITVREA